MRYSLNSLRTHPLHKNPNGKEPCERVGCGNTIGFRVYVEKFHRFCSRNCLELYRAKKEYENKNKANGTATHHNQ